MTLLSSANPSLNLCPDPLSGNNSLSVVLVACFNFSFSISIFLSTFFIVLVLVIVRLCHYVLVIVLVGSIPQFWYTLKIE